MGTQDQKDWELPQSSSLYGEWKSYQTHCASKERDGAAVGGANASQRANASVRD